MKPLKLFWARGTGGGAILRNAGDWYSPLICEHLSGRPVTFAPPQRCDLVAVGSLLHRLNKSHRLHRLGLRRRLHIWGTGSLRAEDRLLDRHHVHAVRGALTRDQIPGVGPDVPLGDPGLLADRLIEPPAARRHPLGVVPHLQDREDPTVRAFLGRHPEAVLIDVNTPVRDVLTAIASCERVLSSSLHGLVFADALSVPNAWITISDRLIGGRHKFDDYYSAFGIRCEPAHLLDVNADTLMADYRRPGLAAVKAALLASFPCP